MLRGEPLLHVGRDLPGRALGDDRLRATQLARTPYGPAWRATSWVSTSMPALAAAYAIGDWALGRRAAADGIVTCFRGHADKYLTNE